jgi:ABC-type transport system substrate-binding protein
MGVLISLLLLAPMPPSVLAADAKVQRIVFASAGFTESNRFWTIARPEHLQYDPFLETLLDVDPKTGEYIPGLAEKWQASADLKEWTFFLRKGVQFHYGFGEFTAKDVVHSHSLMLRSDATATMVGIWKAVEEVKVVNDHQVVLRMQRPMSLIPYAVSRAGDFRMVSKAPWDKEGLEGLRNGRLALACTALLDERPGCPSNMNGRTSTGVGSNRISRSWRSAWCQRKPRGLPC